MQCQVFPTLEDLPYYKANVRSLGKDVLVPSAALRLRKDNGYTPELVYKSDGSGVSYMTVAAVDPYNHVLIAGLVLQYGGFAVCYLAEKAIE
jgi:arylesterase/paraoxonase